MPPTVIPTDFAPFFDYVTAALVAARVVPAASLVIVTALPPERVPHYSADTDILLRGGPERTNEGTATGGGTLDTHSIATMYVIPRSRLEKSADGCQPRPLQVAGGLPERDSDALAGGLALQRCGRHADAMGEHGRARR